MKAIKLSELTNDSGADILMELAPPFLEILSDKGIVDACKAVAGDGKTQADITRIGIVKFTQIINIVLGKKRESFYAAITPLFTENGERVTVDAVRKANLLMTVTELYSVWKDKVFRDFLSSLREAE